MQSDDAQDLWQRKQDIRQQGLANRNAQPNKDVLSRAICDTLAARPEYARATTVMLYLDARGEVRTQPFVPTAIGHGKRVVIPYCVNEQIELFRLEDMVEVELGNYRVLEPRHELRELPGKRVAAAEVELIAVPGVAFDRRGGRIGHGLGFYDRFLQCVRADVPLVALAFECQLFPEIPTATHDVFMDMMITERAVYPGRGRRQ